MYWWVLFIVFQLIAVTAVSVVTLREFISLRRTAWYASLSSGIGWALCFSIVLMIPVDIVDNDANQCFANANTTGEHCRHPISDLPKGLLTVEWNILYWGTFVLSWFVFPFLQSYWLAGDFTKFERFFTSFKENIYIYVIMGVFGIGGLIFLAVKDNLNMGDTRQLVVLLANVYGLVIVILLMGYGLVDIPRYLLRKADRSGWLKHYMLQAAVYKKEADVTKEKLDETMHKIRIVAQKISQDNQLRPFVDRILEKCPDSYRDSTGAVRGFSSVDADKERVKYSQLVSLHQKVMNLDHAYTRASRMYEQIVSKALNLEDVLHSRNSNDRRIEWHFKAPRSGKLYKLKDVLEWYWQIYLYSWTFRVVGCLCALLSIVLVWCEVSMPFGKAHLSPLSLIITEIPLTGIPKQLYCVAILTYMAVCTYTSLFKLQIWDYYRLVPHQQSDANSIMFSANYLCRLAAPLSFNFLLLTFQRDNAPAFSKVMGPMDRYFSLGNQFMYAFPAFVALFCLCTLLNVWGRVARSPFMTNLLANCWPIKKLKIHIEDPRNLAEEGATILRRERESREDNNTGVSFDSVGDISDCFFGSSGIIATRAFSGRFSNDTSPLRKYGGKSSPHPINKFPDDKTGAEERGERLQDSRTLLKETLTRPSFSFSGDKKNRYAKLRSDLP